MQAVFGFVPDDALRPVYDLAGDFLAAMGRQAVHEDGIRIGGGHHVGIDAPVGESLAALFVFGFVTHAGPDIGGDQVGALACLQGVGKFPQNTCGRLTDAVRRSEECRWGEGWGSTFRYGWSQYN